MRINVDANRWGLPTIWGNCERFEREEGNGGFHTFFMISAAYRATAREQESLVMVSLESVTVYSCASQGNWLSTLEEDDLHFAQTTKCFSNTRLMTSLKIYDIPIATKLTPPRFVIDAPSSDRYARYNPIVMTNLMIYSFIIEKLIVQTNTHEI